MLITRDATSYAGKKKGLNILYFLDHEKNLDKIEKLHPRDNIQAWAICDVCIYITPSEAASFPPKRIWASGMLQSRQEWKNTLHNVNLYTRVILLLCFKGMELCCSALYFIC